MNIYNNNDSLGHPEEYIINERGRECDGEPIAIDRLINKLMEFKEKGANYVALEYHCDHIGYKLEAIKIEDASPKVVKEREEKEEKLIAKITKIEELNKQIRKIQNEE